MGQFLNKPNTEKDSHADNIPPNAQYGLSSMQGWRIHMEDAHSHVTDIPALPKVSFFAIFDGHGGKTVAQAGARDIVQCILNSKPLQSASNKTSPDTLEAATRQGLFDLDERIKQEHEELRQGHDRSGSTVVTMFITPTHYIFGNCGDSRAILVSNDEVRFSSHDHKPGSASEEERIKKAGGFVEMGRVCGNLAVSRALGDYEYKSQTEVSAKDQMITCDPDMTTLERRDTDNFIVMACDGIWDVCSNKQIVVFVNFHLERGYTAIQIAEQLLDHCLAQGSKDNMSALVITLAGARKPKRQIPPDETEQQRTARIGQEKRELYEEMAKLPPEDIVQQMVPPAPVGAHPPADANADAPARRLSEDE